MGAWSRSVRSNSTVQLLAGRVVSSLVAIGVAPLLTRLYAPDDFGILSIVTSVVIVSTVAANGASETVVPRVSAAERGNVVQLGLWMSAVAALIFAGISVGVGGALGPSSELRTVLRAFSIAIGVGVFGYGVSGLASAAGLSNQRHGEVAIFRVASAVTAAILQMVLTPFGASGLAAGFALGQLPASVWLLHRLSLQKSGSNLRATLRMPKVRAALTATAPASLLNGLSSQTLPILIAVLYGLRVAGYYALLHRVLAVPATVLGRSLSEDAVSRAAAVFDGHAKLSDLRSYLLRAVLTLLVPGLGVLAVLLIAGTRLFDSVFGEEWIAAADLAVIVAPMYVVQLALAPVSRMLSIFDGDRVQLAWDASRLAGLVIAFVWQMWAEPPVEFGLAVFAGWLSLMYVIQGVLVEWRMRDEH